ncbi:MAG: SMI1/KNR4 family protein [Eubacteriales bacterium]|nr:SMI1/KNR4 family protein [Eubacteriales bacterium]
MNTCIIETIKKYEEPGDFTHYAVTDEILTTAETVLNVKLPEQYISFLKMFGHGGICGLEVMGVGLTGRMIFVDTTLDYRDEGLPDNLVAIENVDEWLTCIDCNTGKIVSWDFSGYIKEDYMCFDDYLMDQMNSAIENM